MKWNSVKNIDSSLFKRLTGITRKTFDSMVKILHHSTILKKIKGGRPSKLSVMDQLLMTLEYLREYRTYFHIANGYGVSESSCYKTMKWIEEVLINSKEFALPGKKTLLKSDMKYEAILIDATETPIERPKKNSVFSTQAKRKSIHSKAR